MTTEIDFNQVAAKVTADLLKATIASAGKLAGAELNNLQAAFQLGAANFLKATYRKVSTVKTLIHPQDSEPTLAMYVPLNFSSYGDTYKDIDVLNAFKRGGGALVTGTAGSGKSMFMRVITLKMIADNVNFLPFHYDLRQLNDGPDLPLIERLHDELSTHLKTMTVDVFTKQVQNGRIALILDGYDEIDYERRDKYGKEILRLVLDFPKCKLLVSSRPDEQIAHSAKITVFAAKEMSLEQCKLLIERIKYDPDSKSAFIAALEDGLFQQHTEFLSSPLLATMMLLTFSEFSEVPSNITAFYKQAFEVVYQRHDRIKGAYTRRTHTKLPINDFEKIFSYFCALSYIQQKLQFSEVDILNYIKSSSDHCGIQVLTTNYLQDLIKSTCLIQRDGLHYTFTHRSFQEYFTALYISRLGTAEAAHAIDTILRRGLSEKVLTMIYGINAGLLEETWSNPAVNQIIDSVKNLDAANNPGAFFNVFWRKFIFMENSIAFPGEEQTETGELLSHVQSVYSELYRTFVDIPYEDRPMSEILRETGVLEDLRTFLNENEIEYLSTHGELSEEYPLDMLSARASIAFGISDWAVREAAFINTLRVQISERATLRQRAFSTLFHEPF